MTEKEIKTLLERFMDGQTSVEEEQALAEYFRTHDVDDEWKAYKEMFAWFDEGMPEEEAEPQRDRKPWRKIVALAVAAAAVVLIIIGVMPKDANKSTIGRPVSQIMATAERPAYHDDTTATDTVKIAEPVKRKDAKTPRRHRYSPAPPKVYYAMNTNDSLLHDGEKRAEEEVLKIYARQEKMLQDIFIQSERQERELRLMLATMDYETECATEEEVY